MSVDTQAVNSSQAPRPNRLLTMRPSAIRQIHDLWQLQKQRDPARSWVALHFGEPDLGTPPFIVDAGCEALRQGAVFYENNAGRPDLKAALAQFYTDRQNIDLSPDHFLLTCGGTQAIALVMLGLLGPGDEAINITPAWPNFTGAAHLAGAVVHELPLAYDPQQRRFAIDFEALDKLARQCRRLRLVIVNSPSNPTGWVMSGQQKRQLLALCRDRGAYLLADEIYDRIEFGNEPSPSFLQVKQPDDRVIIINGFSKSYCMTGWRLGYLIAEPDLTAKMAQMQEFITSHAPSMAQVAAITALRDGEPFIGQSLERYHRLRDLITDRLAALPGAQVPHVDGGIYIFFRVPGCQDSVSFCHRLLDEAGVILAPGSAFGAGGEGWLRLCFAAQEQALHEAVDRLATLLDRAL